MVKLLNLLMDMHSNHSDWHSMGKKIIRIQNLTDSSKTFNLTKLKFQKNIM